MPTALVLRPAGGPLGEQPGPGGGAAPAELAAQLSRLGYAAEPVAPAGLAGRLATVPAGEPVALVDAGLVAHPSAVRLVLVGLRGRLAEPASGPGMLAVPPAARAPLVAAVAAAATADGWVGQSREATRVAADPVAEVTARLADRVAVRAVDVAPLVAGVPDDAAARAELERARAAVDEERVWLAATIKRDDSLFTVTLISRWTGYVARALARRGVSPDAVTTAALLGGFAAAALAATGQRAGYVAAGVLVLAAFIADVVDGQIARYAGRYSRLGGYLDATFDRAREYALFAGLAAGAGLSGHALWGLAAAAMGLQTVRHQLHSAFAACADAAEPAEPAAGAAGAASSAGSAGLVRSAPLRDRLRPVPRSVSVRRALLFPLGERSAVTAVLVAVTTPRITLWALIGLGLLALGYGLAGRIRRSLARPSWPATADPPLRTMLDAGPLASFRARPPGSGDWWGGALALLALGTLPVAGGLVAAGLGDWWGRYLLLAGALGYAFALRETLTAHLFARFDWLAVPLARAVELGVPVVAGWVIDPGTAGAAFGLVAACALHHYDTVYRLAGTPRPPNRAAALVAGGTEGRVVAVAALVAAGALAQLVGLTVLAVGLGALFLADAGRAAWPARRAVPAGSATSPGSGEPA